MLPWPQVPLTPHAGVRSTLRFRPPHCPDDACPSHSSGERWRFVRNGFYSRECDGHRIQRYRCSECRLEFSTQSFRGNYREQRPDIDTEVYQHFVAKVTQRQSARILAVDKKTIGRRLKRFGAICRAFHSHLAPMRDSEKLMQGGFMLDEGESYAKSRRNNPLTYPVLIHRDSFFVVHAEVGPLPRRGGKGRDEDEPEPLDTPERKARAQGSRLAVERCVAALGELLPENPPVLVKSDMKQSYGEVLRARFGERLVHETTSSTAPRGTSNPLFRINLTLAMMRDGLSRLVRRTWAASKLAARLLDHTWVWITYRNYVRGKTNDEWETTPAIQLGVCGRKLTPADVLRWGAAYVAALCKRVAN